MSSLPEFDRVYAPMLGGRTATFRLMFQLLEQRRPSGHLIVETGCVREAGTWAGEGQSTVLFDRFAQQFDGQVVSVDCSEKSCAVARSLVSERTSVTCADSVAFLDALVPSRPIDLLYLDSFDLDWGNPHPSSLHHLLELCAVWPKLAPGAVIAVDDNANGRGKGAYVAEFLKRVGIAPVASAYQIVWVR